MILFPPGFSDRNLKLKLEFLYHRLEHQNKSLPKRSARKSSALNWLTRKQNTDKCLYFFLSLFSLVLFSSLGKQPIVIHFIFLKKSKTKQSESVNSQTKISPGQISRNQISTSSSVLVTAEHTPASQSIASVLSSRLPRVLVTPRVSPSMHSLFFCGYLLFSR